MFSVHIFIQYGITCPFAPFPTFIHYDIISHYKYQNIYKHLSEFDFHSIVLIQKYQKAIMGFHVCMVGALLLLSVAFDDDSALAQSLLLNLFTRYLHDDKNNELTIFMLTGSIQFSLHFILTQIIGLF